MCIYFIYLYVTRLFSPNRSNTNNFQSLANPLGPHEIRLSNLLNTREYKNTTSHSPLMFRDFGESIFLWRAQIT